MRWTRIAALVAAAAACVVLGATAAHASPSSGWGAPAAGTDASSWY